MSYETAIKILTLEQCEITYTVLRTCPIIHIKLFALSSNYIASIYVAIGNQTIIYNPSIYHEKSNIPFSYMLCLFCKKPIGELNLKRALDEDTGVFSSFFSFLSSSSPLGQTAVSGNPTLHQ